MALSLSSHVNGRVFNRIVEPPRVDPLSEGPLAPQGITSPRLKVILIEPLGRKAVEEKSARMGLDIYVAHSGARCQADNASFES